MDRKSLAQLAAAATCRVFGLEDAGNDAQREVLGTLIRGFADRDATILCEPSLARKTTRPPDVVLVDLVAGMHVIEVKGINLDQIEALEPGGQFRVRYTSTVQARNPFAQVRRAMFDIKDAVERSFAGELVLPFKYWVALAAITRQQWQDKWGADALSPPELLFADDLAGLAERRKRTPPPLAAWSARGISWV